MILEYGIVLISLIGIASLCISYVLYRSLRSERLAQHNLAQQVVKLQCEVRALYAGAVGVGERLSRQERKIKRLNERQEQVEIKTNGDRPYDQAIRMVKNGSSLDEIISICNLTRGEAELITMMHQLDKAS